jgi:hypothetical protein
MERPSLSEIVEALHKAGIPPQVSADQSRFFIKVLRSVATGYPVSPERLREIASDLHMPLDDTNVLLRQISEIDETENIVGMLVYRRRNIHTDLKSMAISYLPGARGIHYSCPPCSSKLHR